MKKSLESSLGSYMEDLTKPTEMNPNRDSVLFSRKVDLRNRAKGDTEKTRWCHFWIRTEISLTGKIPATDGVFFPGSGSHPGQVVLGIGCCPLHINFFS